MTKEEILFWRDKYDKEEDLFVREVEDKLRKKFHQNHFITKPDLQTIIKWKFQGRLLGRQKRFLKVLKSVDEKFIKEVSRLAFRSREDETRLKLLSSIKMVGNALASVILTFYDPKNYGVLDIHAWRGLFWKEPPDIFSNSKHAIKFFTKLREISQKTGLPCRDIEKAIFKKDLDKSKNCNR